MKGRRRGANLSCEVLRVVREIFLRGEVIYRVKLVIGLSVEAMRCVEITIVMMKNYSQIQYLAPLFHPLLPALIMGRDVAVVNPHVSTPSITDYRLWVVSTGRGLNHGLDASRGNVSNRLGICCKGACPNNRMNLQ